MSKQQGKQAMTYQQKAREANNNEENNQNTLTELIQRNRMNKKMK